MSKTIARLCVNADDALGLKVLEKKGFGSDIYTKENLEVAAETGKSHALSFLVEKDHHPFINHGAKIDAMFKAAQANQFDSVKVLAESGVSLTYALGAITDHPTNKAFIEKLVNEIPYEPNAADLNFFKVSGKTTALDAIHTRNDNEQKLYKEAYQTLMADPNAPEQLNGQKTMLEASAQGTAQHIDHHVFNGEPVNNPFRLLKNLGVATWHGNDDTVKALLKHGAQVEQPYLAIAERYLKPETTELMQTAYKEQSYVQDQKPHLSTEPTKGRPQKAKTKNKGLSL